MRGASRVAAERACALRTSFEGGPVMSLRLASRALGRCVALTGLLVAAGARPAAAQCGGAQLCGPGSGDCTVGADCTITVPPGGLVVDLGPRRFVLTRNLMVSGAPNDGLTIMAHDVLLNGGSITAPGAADSSGFVSAGTVTIISATNFTVQTKTPTDVSAPSIAR